MRARDERGRAGGGGVRSVDRNGCAAARQRQAREARPGTGSQARQRHSVVEATPERERGEEREGESGRDVNSSLVCAVRMCEAVLRLRGTRFSS